MLADVSQTAVSDLTPESIDATTVHVSAYDGVEIATRSAVEPDDFRCEIMGTPWGTKLKGLDLGEGVEITAHAPDRPALVLAWDHVLEAFTGAFVPPLAEGTEVEIAFSADSALLAGQTFVTSVASLGLELPQPMVYESAPMSIAWTPQPGWGHLGLYHQIGNERQHVRFALCTVWLEAGVFEIDTTSLEDLASLYHEEESYRASHPEYFGWLPHRLVLAGAMPIRSELHADVAGNSVLITARDERAQTVIELPVE